MENFDEYVKKEAKQISQVEHWLDMTRGVIPHPHQPQPHPHPKRPMYLIRMRGKQCSSLTKVKARVLPVKANYGDRYENQTCRLYQEEDKTQKPVLNECKITKEKTYRIYEMIQGYQLGSRLLSDSCSNSLTVGIYPAANVQRYVFISLPNKMIHIHVYEVCF